MLHRRSSRTGRESTRAAPASATDREREEHAYQSNRQNEAKYVVGEKVYTVTQTFATEIDGLNGRDDGYSVKESEGETREELSELED